jgi:hypothetical protein
MKYPLIFLILDVFLLLGSAGTLVLNFLQRIFNRAKA